MKLALNFVHDFNFGAPLFYTELHCAPSIAFLLPCDLCLHVFKVFLVFLVGTCVCVCMAALLVLFLLLQHKSGSYEVCAQ